MASGGSSGRGSSGLRSFDFGSDDVLCAYDDYVAPDSSNGKRPESSGKDFHEARTGRPLVNVFGQQDEYPKEEIITAVEKCMKKYADNLMRFLEGISGRLSQLELYCYKLERSIGEFRADMIRDQSEANTKLKSLEKHLQEVHRSIQILRDKQELAETQKELAKMQVKPTESSAQAHSQKLEESVTQPPLSEPKRHDGMPTMSNQHLALALPHQIAGPNSLPPRAPEQTQIPMQQQQQQQQQPLPPQPQQQQAAQDRYVLNQSASFYPQQSQAVQPELQYIQPRPQMQDLSAQAALPPPPQQPQMVNQTQPQQAFPQYQQQWTQQSPPQFPQQVAAPSQQPTSQAQIMRPHTPSPAYPPYPTPRPANPTQETFSYTTIPQSGYGTPGSAVNMQQQPQQQASSQSSFGQPLTKTGSYMGTAPYPPHSHPQGYNTMYMDGGRTQNYQPGSYPPPANVSVLQSQQLPPSNSMGLHHAGSQVMRSHPYGDMIEKAVSMGYPRDQVVGVINRLAESGQPVDFNTLLDRLNTHASGGGTPRAWSG